MSIVDDYLLDEDMKAIVSIMTNKKIEQITNSDMEEEISRLIYKLQSYKKKLVMIREYHEKKQK